MIFVDTSAWYACVIPSDPSHAAALAWLQANTEPLLTTDYIVDEILTLLQMRGHPARARALGDGFFGGNHAAVFYLAEANIHAAWQLFRQFDDKQWSFTDCTSKVVIESLGVTEAFAFDHHFQQFGTVTVVPRGA